MNQENSIYLFSTEGGSDKEYHLHLRQVQGGWCAYYANGPRGRVCQSKHIKEGVFSYEQALAMFDDKLKSKTKAGYTQAESGVRFSNSEKQNQASGHAQQLPTAVTASQAQDMMGNLLFAAQEKANGERRTIEVVSGRVRGINKLGLYVNLPENLEQAFSGFGDCVFDGEQVGAHMHVFDLLSFGGKDMRALPFGERYQALEEDVLGSMYKSPGWPITLLQAAFTESDKRALFERIQELNGEGLVFKRVDGAYEAGRSKSVFKYKFIESCTCVVLQRNQQRSVGLALYDANDLLVPVGNVTVPQNFDVPKEGDLVEVQYLYYNPEGAFEQPVYLGPRVDVLPHEANLKQVTRLKPGVAMDELGRRIKPESEEPLAQVMPRQRGG